MNKKVIFINGQYLLVAARTVFKRLLTSFFIIFLLFSGFMPYVFADEIGYEPQTSQYTEAVDEGGKTPQAQTPSVDTSANTANMPKPSQGVVDMATGAFTYSYDFHLPEGQNGYVPPFSMSYNSNNGHIKSTVGKGWKLDIPEIVRLNKNGVERMYDETNFTSSMDGDLVKISKEKDQFGVYGVKNGYGTYTFEKDGSWTFKDKSGFIFTFGITSKDREGSVGKYSKWMLSKIIDNHGHEYVYLYDSFQGHPYLTTILYPKNQFSVNLQYDKYDQNPYFTYQNAQQTVQDRYLSEVIIKQVAEVKNTFKLVQGTNESLDSVDSSIPSYSVTFSNEVKYLNNLTPTTTTTATNYNFYNYTLERWLDIDGNGVLDKMSDLNMWPYYAYHNKVTMNGRTTITTLPQSGTNYPYQPYLFGKNMIDIDADGEVDFVSSEANVGVNNYTYYKQNIRNNTLTTKTEIARTTQNTFKFDNIDNDGIVDWYTTNIVNQQQSVSIYNLVNSELVKKPSITIVGKKMTAEPFFVDINGDGDKDILSGIDAFMKHGEYYEYTALFALTELTDQIKQNENKPQYISTIAAGDVNADGLMDIVLNEKWPNPTSGLYPDTPIITKFINTGKNLVKLTDCTNPAILGSCFESDKVILIKAISVGPVQYSYAIVTSVEYSSERVEKTNIFGYPTRVFAVSKITNPGAVTEYTYKNALEYFNPAEPTKKVTFFESVTAKDSLGRTKTTYFHQGNGGEIGDTLYTAGRPYKEEVRAPAANPTASGELLSESYIKYGEFDMGSGRRYVYNLSTLSKIYGSSPKTSAVAYTYDTAIGEVVRVHDFGDVDSAADSDVFADIGTDKITTSMKYSLRYGLVRVSEVKKESSQGLMSHQKYTYNESGDTIKVETADQVGSFISYLFEFDAVGNMTAAIDPLGNRQTYTYNQYGTPVSSTNAVGQTTTYIFDEFIGEPTKITTPDGVVIQYTYTPEGYLKDTIKNGVVVATNGIYFNQTYIQVTSTKFIDTRRASPDNLMYPMLESESRISTEQRYTYGGQLTFEMNSALGSTNYTYDAVGRLIKKETTVLNSTAGDVLATTNTYNAFDRVVSTTDAKGTSNYSYGIDTQKNSTVTYTRSTDTSTKKYNSRGLLVSNTDALGEITTYIYNQNGNVIQITDAEGNIKIQDFDLMGKKLYTSDIHNPSDATFGSYHFVYNKNGQLVSELRPGLITISYQYDNAGRLLKKIGNDKTVNYSYDTCKAGYLCSVSTNGVSTDYTYNAAGNMVKENQSIYDKSLEIRYVYNNFGTLIRTIYPQDTVDYMYDGQGYMAQMYVNGQKMVNITTSGDWNNRIQYEGGKIKQINLVNGLTYKNTYNNNGVGERTARTLSKGTTKLLDTDYTYNSNMLMTDFVENGESVKRTISYEYDPLQRLATETVSADGVIPASSITYTYSASGNMITKGTTSLNFGTGFESEIVRPVAASLEVVVPLQEPAPLEQPRTDTTEKSANITSFLFDIFKTNTAYADQLTLSEQKSVVPVSLGVPVTPPASLPETPQEEVTPVTPPATPIVCPEGQIWVGEICTTPTPVVTTCDEGKILNENGQCVVPTPPVTPTCAADERLVRNVCVKVQLLPLGCPVGQSQVGSACIPEIITCPPQLTVGLDGYCHDATDLLYCSSYMKEQCTFITVPPPLAPVNFDLVSIYNSLQDFLAATDEFKDTLIYSITRKNKTDLTFQKDQAGIAVIKNGDTSVTITFTEPFATVPLVTLGATSSNTPYLHNLSTAGMKIVLSNRASSDTEIHWFAKGLTDKQIKRNTSDGSDPIIVTPTECSRYFQKVGDNCVPIPETETQGAVDYYTPQSVTKTTDGTSTTIYSYDKQGNLIHTFTTDGITTKDTNYLWNSFGELTQTTEPTQSHNYLYNQNSIRVYKEDITGDTQAPVTTKTYYFNNYTQYSDTDYTIDIPLVEGISITLHNNSGTKTLSYNFTNHLGTTELTTNSTGTITDTYISTSYGTTQVTTGDNQKKFALHRIDSDSLIYMNARYYSPYTSSFISKDPMSTIAPESFLTDPLQMNLYSYARNNPVMWNDPTGKTGSQYSFGLAKGGFKEVKNTVKDIVQMVIKPGKTVANIARALSNPRQTGVAIANAAVSTYNTAMNSPSDEEAGAAVGQAAVMALSFFVPSPKASKINSVSKVGKVALIDRVLVSTGKTADDVASLLVKHAFDPHILKNKGSGSFAEFGGEIRTVTQFNDEALRVINNPTASKSIYRFDRQTGQMVEGFALYDNVYDSVLIYNPTRGGVNSTFFQPNLGSSMGGLNYFNGL